LIQVDTEFPGRQERKIKMALITGEGERWVHMARLAIVGSHTVNGVSELHSRILKEKVFEDFYLISPEKFRNVTNGITPRRWLLEVNRPLARLITDAIGDLWTKDLNELNKLEPLADDSEFRKRFREIKELNKVALSNYLGLTANLTFSHRHLLDCQVKRLHEYKRQLLNVLHAITLYNRLREGRLDETFTPRTILFAGKAAPGYYLCKLIIKLMHVVGDAIAAHPLVRKKLRVIFVPNYNVSLAGRIIPAADLSEQISTAGLEASGTSNMKFALNGALTIGTLDGANVEIREQVGAENFFLFGLKAEEIMAMSSGYNPQAYYETEGELRQAINQILEGHFSPDNQGLFHPIVRSVLEGDRFYVLADYASYISCQENVADAYKDKDRWTRMAILNVARSGKFSSDRAIREYAEKIWHISPVNIE
jgi:starch phosphorylase